MAKVPRFTKELHVLVTPDHYEALKGLNGESIAHHIRRSIDALMGNYNKDLSEMEKRLLEIEPEYLALKKGIEEILKKKAVREAESRVIDKRVEESHVKLIELLKTYHNQVDKIPMSYFKVYSDFCGGVKSPQAFKYWLEEEGKRLGLIKSISP
jgi:hypothetical protein